MDYHLIKEGDLFLLTDQAGNILKNEDSQYGLYAKDTRFLSSYELFINNIKPLVLSSGDEEDSINNNLLNQYKF